MTNTKRPKNVSEKECTQCHLTKPLTEFYRSSYTKDGRYSSCSKCHLALVHSSSRNGISHREEFRISPTPRVAAILAMENIHKRITPSRFKQNPTYRNIECRVNQAVMTRFFEDCWDEFLRVYSIWKESGFQRNLYPSLDRINTKGHYEIGNIRVLPLRENISRDARKPRISRKISVGQIQQIIDRWGDNESAREIVIELEALIDHSRRALSILKESLV